MTAHLYRVLLSLLILIPFTVLVLTPFFDLDLFFCTISWANEWKHTFIYSFTIETRTIFVTSDVALMSSFEKCFYVWKVFNFKNIGIFLIKLFSTQIIKYFSTTRKFFCIFSVIDHSPSRFRVEINFWFCNISVFVSLHTESKAILITIVFFEFLSFL